MALLLMANLSSYPTLCTVLLVYAVLLVCVCGRVYSDSLCDW